MAIPSDQPAGNLRPEYDFDYSKAKPNRFAGRVKPVVRSVRLDADLAAAFPTEAAVNAALREYLRTHPQPAQAPTDAGA
jgi:uncharacterized protein (DUF4415 family)